jgi:hypothetical protein
MAAKKEKKKFPYYKAFAFSLQCLVYSVKFLSY